MDISAPIIALKSLWQTRVKKRPIVLSHAINSNCNMSCKFCEYWKENSAEMTFEEIIQLLNEAKSFGIIMYNAWTVEPLLREDLPLILSHAKKIGLITFLITNGLLLEKRAHELNNLDYLSVSVDGLKSYELIRGVDFYKKILPGIVKAKENMKNPILLNCVISGKNLDDIEDLIKLAQELDVKIGFEPLHEFFIIEKSTLHEMGITDIDKYKMTINNIIRMKKDGYPIINSYSYLKMIREKNTNFKCHAADLILNVSADGTIEHCRVERGSLGNVINGLKNMWEKNENMRKQIPLDCQRCLFYGYVENSLLYDMNIDVLRHYKWM